MRATPRNPGATPGDVILGGFALVCVLVPCVGVVLSVARGLTQPDAEVPMPDPGLLLTTALASGGTALLATIIAYPVAVATLRWGSRWLALLLVPMLMPAYLAYAGWGLLRAPGTALGDWLAGLGASGAAWAPIAAGRSLAVVGLALWSFPIAALVIGAGARRIDPGVMQALALEPSARRHLEILKMLRAPILGAWAVITLVMLGSAVPFHVAQIETYAIGVWLELSLAGADERWRAHALALPLVAIGVCGAWLLVSKILKPYPSAESQDPSPATPRQITVFGIALALSVLAPLLLFLTNVRSFSSFADFWRVSGSAVGNSAIDAIIAGAIGSLLCVCSAWSLSGRRRTLVGTLSIRLFAVAGLVPGVLVGSALVTTYGSVDWIGGTRVIAVLGDAARFGFVACLVGAFAARLEPADTRRARAIDGAVGASGWWAAAGRPLLPVFLGAGVVTGLLSLHEIEASVLLEPPGSGSLAQQLLADLHYARTEAMSAGAGQIMLIGLLGAVLGATLIARREPPASRGRTRV